MFETTCDQLMAICNMSQASTAVEFNGLLITFFLAAVTGSLMVFEMQS